MSTFLNKLLHHAKSSMLSQRQPLVWTINVVLGALSYYLAFAIRFNTFNFFSKLSTLMMIRGWILSLLLAVALKILMLTQLKVFTGLWRYVSTHDLVRLLKALALYSVLFMSLTMLVWGHRIPRTVYVIDFLISLLFYAGLRLSVRLYRELRTDFAGSRDGKRFLIIGAGDAGEIASRSLIQEPHLNNTVVGYIDDDVDKMGRLIHGIPVLGGREKIAEAIRTLRVSDVLIAISDAPKDLTEYTVKACSGFSVSFRILPSFRDLASGRIEVQRIRSVEIEDLLGRRSVRLDSARIRASVQEESVLVTGAGGSIGSELARQMAAFSPARLLLLDSAETPLFEIQQEILARYPALRLETFLCNIKDDQAVNIVFDKSRPTLVYHAAAYKHVPMLEAHPEQAVLNNIVGTRHLAEAACRVGVKRFVMISTDKAVQPSSVMGASKRICELVVSSMPEKYDTCFTAVRFGNVLGSNGSVVPTFRRQIAGGGPVTITHQDMTRFFMTIPEAVQLVLHCGLMAERNNIFVLDMGTPVRIMDLARNMIRLSGLEPDRDIEIKITGLRPGEKMHEELVTYGEELYPTTIEKINVLRRNAPAISPASVLDLVGRLESTALESSSEAVKSAIWSLILLDASFAALPIGAVVSMREKG